MTYFSSLFWNVHLSAAFSCEHIGLSPRCYHTDKYLRRSIIKIQLFESNAKPHLYVCAIKYWKRPRTKPSTMRLAHTDGSVERELRRFGHAFLKKTGVPWDKRLAHADKKTGIVVGPASRDDRWYSYQMPVSR